METYGRKLRLTRSFWTVPFEAFVGHHYFEVVLELNSFPCKPMSHKQINRKNTGHN